MGVEPVTELLHGWRAGDRVAGDRLMELVYDELYRIASSYLRGERKGHTLSTVDLVAEAYLRLAGADQPAWSDRVHFYAIAARTMRRILVDHARKRSAGKRDAGHALTEDPLAASAHPEDMLAIDRALEELSALDERRARAVELHYFGGMTHAEIGEALGVHENTVARDLKLAQAFMRRALTPEAS